jgi:hypothetical protein
MGPEMFFHPVILYILIFFEEFIDPKYKNPIDEIMDKAI